MGTRKTPVYDRRRSAVMGVPCFTLEYIEVPSRVERKPAAERTLFDDAAIARAQRDQETKRACRAWQAERQRQGQR